MLLSGNKKWTKAKSFALHQKTAPIFGAVFCITLASHHYEIALQLSLILGKKTADKAKWAADYGVQGIELVKKNRF